ncbi:hydrogenase maturation protease [Rhodococcus sp. OK270]|jgi:hydrogenase maturation protease|uniref:hydrogenase maturation protease n=1 Tax=unclassified Rhodococcus (in: high G+C Gram-positive bacteria) TaxID=192944 RepID=UPI000BDD88D8|nr:hydrogenase maturation protease [Rhodococcus sp. OK611]SNX88840.1 hydrogenase maturation protease [Rhodococcus sp. OK270]
MTAVLIALGDEFRRDDGVGPAVARALRSGGLPAQVLISQGDPVELIESWSGAAVAVVLDAVRMEFPQPGRVHVLDPADLDTTAATGTHGFDLGAAIALGHAIGRMPDRLVIIGVEVADMAHGPGLSPDVARAAPIVARAVVDTLFPGKDVPLLSPGALVRDSGAAPTTAESSLRTPPSRR